MILAHFTDYPKDRSSERTERLLNSVFRQLGFLCVLSTILVLVVAVLVAREIAGL